MLASLLYCCYINIFYGLFILESLCILSLFYLKVCASSNTGIFAFFAFITLNLNVMVDIMFSAMIDIMINGALAGAGNILLHINIEYNYLII